MNGPALPSGTVTLLFTDIEGSTRLWEERRQDMRRALARHDKHLRAVIESRGGIVFKTVGDAFCAVFADTRSAVEAAAAGQRGLQEGEWPVPLRVRMALHRGEPECRDGDYFGPPVNRVARILSAAHGGQILLSQAAAEDAPGVPLRDHGAHRLKDLTQPEHLFSLELPDLAHEFPPLRSLSTHPNNLPAQATPFVGRSRELAELHALLDEGARLVTLTGIGGTGKTRLALQAAAERIERHPGGVWWVDLSVARDADRVLPAIAAALDVPEEGGRTPANQIAERLNTAPALLVLDNFEQVLEAASAAAQLLAACPRLQVLVTSRSVLSLSAERELVVPELSSEDAAVLFVDRARAVRPGYTPDEPSRKAIAAICARLEGIPLAIELAAAQVRVLPPAQIERGLDRRLRLLVSPFRDSAARQRTLRAALDWSYDLLEERERLLLARLSVFAGGFDLTGAEEVLGDPLVLTGLQRLREQSLLKAGENEGTARFRMLETVREYGAERLESQGEEGRFRERHAFYYLALAESKGEELPRCEADNVRAACDWLLESGCLEEAARLMVAAAPAWERMGWYREARDRLEACLPRDAIQATPLRARVLREAGWFCHLLGDLTRSESLGMAALEAARAAGDREGESMALSNLAAAVAEQGRAEEAAELAGRSAEVLRGTGSSSRLAGRLCNLGLFLARAGRIDDARARLREACALAEADGDLLTHAAALCNLSDLSLKTGDYTDSRARAAESVALFRHLDEKRGLATALTSLAQAACEEGLAEEAARALREAVAVCAELEAPALLLPILDSVARLQEIRGELAQSLWAIHVARALRARLGVRLSEEDEGCQATLERRLRGFPVDTAPRAPAETTPASVLAWARAILEEDSA